MICLLVNFLYAFTDSLKEHTAGSQCLHAFGRLKVAISSFNAIVPLSKGVNGTDYLLKLVLDNFNCWWRLSFHLCRFVGGKVGGYCGVPESNLRYSRGLTQDTERQRCSCRIYGASWHKGLCHSHRGVHRALLSQTVAWKICHIVISAHRHGFWLALCTHFACAYQ